MSGPRFFFEVDSLYSLRHVFFFFFFFGGGVVFYTKDFITLANFSGVVELVLLYEYHYAVNRTVSFIYLLLDLDPLGYFFSYSSLFLSLSLR